MPTAVVTGANSGIGNALAQILVKEGYKVIGADITLGDEIKKLGCQSEQLDVASPESIQAFKQKVGDQSVDLLLNIAGVAASPSDDNLESVNASLLHRNFTINTFGPLLLTQALLPNILKSSNPRVVVMSSRMGSIADNSTGGWYAYRGSKAAVNALFKSLAVDLKDRNVPVVLLHPGIVKTNIFQGQSWEGIQGAVEADQAAAELWRVLMSKGLESTGKWWHRNGEELPW
ncbi:short-chain alcohol dehydrogenase-like protein [Lindgomyces ingoldianus]|uniref:Short-chain alcohol dehydrogenase-like protein n=1 Tax=Lindgomyces ingoldianus TaxID=673940 RepID=A0ACB6QWJ9_9PLEO|nr:short-chain alcohol dehydrogenase-like protein [Lindgomyces ingoldianus]KAF2470667.1 short-chain alcohol dehydrogenase-like protein [Lindgomyces ingoldianus]